MEQITLIKRGTAERIDLFNKEPFRTVKAATQSKSLMGIDTVTLTILSREVLSFDKGDYIQVNGEDYYIRTKVNKELLSDDYFKYDVVFYGVLYDLMKTPYRDMDSLGKSSRNTFDLVYTLKQFIRVIINNTNKDYPGLWVFSETGCPDVDPKQMQFSCNNCLEALQAICKEFEVDFRITQDNGVRTIEVGSFGEIVTPPDGSSWFEWGRGKGLYSLKEEKVDDRSIKTRIWVEGGTSNIPSGYRGYSERLQLPLLHPDPENPNITRRNKKAHTLSDGTYIAANSEDIGITNENCRYIEDATLSATIGVDAEQKQYDDIKPTKTGTVSDIVSGDVNSFIDASMDFDLNRKEGGNTVYLINGTSAKITFIDGLLAGQQFELQEYNHTTKKFTLKPYQDSRGLVLPTQDNTAFRIGVGNKYKITDIIPPQEIIDDAEEDLWYKGYDDLRKDSQPRVKYGLTLNRMMLLEETEEDADQVLFSPGDYVPVKDTRFGVQKNIRIQQVDRNLLLRQDYNLTISDTASTNAIVQTVVDVQKHETIITMNGLKDLGRARRGWRTTEELRNMVFDTDGFFDTNNIRANSIDTNMLTVGSKSQQFILVGVVIEPNKGGSGNKFAVSSGQLVHLTINEDSPVIWNMSLYNATFTTSTARYLYAKCSKSTSNGVFVVSETQYKFEPDTDQDNYYFLIGIIGSLIDGWRDFQTTYGFTRINGNTITTGKITTQDGECFLDLDGNRFRIGSTELNSWIDWNESEPNRLTLHNVDVLSDSEERHPIGVFRGVFNSDVVYYKGDEVSYTTNGNTATYRYENPTPSKGHNPTESAYWGIVAKGKDGKDGMTEEKVFKRTKANIKPEAPGENSQTDDFVPTGWTDDPTGTDAEYPYEWVSIRKKESGTWGNFQAPTIWQTFSLVANPNLLEQTDFESIDKLGRWIRRSWYASIDGNEYPDEVSAGDHIVPYYKDGCNAYYDVVRHNSFEIGYKEVLSQLVWADNPIYRAQKIQHEKWYTISFWARNYGTPLHLKFTCANNNRPVYDNTESIYIDGIEVRPNGQNVRPDGTIMSTPQYPRPDGDMLISFSSGNSIRKHTVTFKTCAAYSGSYSWGNPSVFIIFQLPPTDTSGNVHLCMIKLEEGVIATAYAPNTSDLHPYFYEYRYKKNGSRSVAPDMTGDVFDYAEVANPTGWTTEQPTVGSLEYLWQIVAKKWDENTLVTAWSKPQRITPYDAVESVSPAPVFRGNFDSSGTTVYIGNQYRVDVVKYNGVYYVANRNAGSFTGDQHPPTDGAYWNDFGAQFESVATNLLLAEMANVGGLIFHNNRLESQATDSSGNPLIVLDGVNGNGVYGGTVKAKLLYSQTLYVTDSNSRTYTIDPTGSPAHTYVIGWPDNERWLILPDANTFDGLEIQVFIAGGGSSVYIKCSNVNQSLFIHTGIVTGVLAWNAGNFTTVDLDKPFSDAKGTVAGLCHNMMHLFKAIGGAWYDLTGVGF